MPEAYGKKEVKKYKIGEILVDKQYISQAELQNALNIQNESTDYIPLGQICIEQGYISGMQLSEILRKYRKHIHLGELLINMGLIDDKQLEIILKKQGYKKKRLGELLIESGFVTEEQLVKSLSIQLGFPIINPNIELIDQKLAMRFNEAFLRRQEALPAFEKDGVVTLIMVDPLAEHIINDFEKFFNAKIEPAIASRSAIYKVFDQLFHKIEYGQRDTDLDKEKNLVIIGNVDYLTENKDDIVNIVNYIISSAITQEASDIHIEPQAYNIRIRYRIDGVLQHRTDLPKYLAPSLISRIKVMCGMNIAEHRRHQDGRIEARVRDNDIDLRVSIYSAVYGENVVIRILKRKTKLMDMNKLGFSPINMRYFKKIVEAPSGIILVCGPTGSGKTTTLYACLSYLNTLDKKIITVEDPVEYTIEGIVQGQLNPKLGISYSDFIASMMRQDPDVLMVGEIRDNIAAEATIQTALTGHKAFSTFHTEDTTGALLRLINMGIETFLISSTVVSVIAQRLVRLICPNCKERYEPDPKIFASFGIKNVDVSKFSFSHGKGCEFCHNTGYKGRTAIHEILVINDDIRDKILRRSMASDIRTVARKSANMVTMREDGFYKAAKGITTLDEILRVIFYIDSDLRYLRECDEVMRQLDGKNIKIIEESTGVWIKQEINEEITTEESPKKNANEAPQRNANVSLQKNEILSNLKISSNKDELYRIRFETDSILQEHDRIEDFFQQYQILNNECGKIISQDLLPDFVDFIIYYTNLSNKKFRTLFVEYFLKKIEEEVKIFIQFQTDKASKASSYLQKARGRRLIEFLA